MKIFQIDKNGVPQPIEVTQKHGELLLKRNHISKGGLYLQEKEIPIYFEKAETLGKEVQQPEVPVLQPKAIKPIESEQQFNSRIAEHLDKKVLSPLSDEPTLEHPATFDERDKEEIFTEKTEFIKVKETVTGGISGVNINDLQSEFDKYIEPKSAVDQKRDAENAERGAKAIHDHVFEKATKEAEKEIFTEKTVAAKTKELSKEIEKPTVDKPKRKRSPNKPKPKSI